MRPNITAIETTMYKIHPAKIGDDKVNATVIKIFPTDRIVVETVINHLERFGKFNQTTNDLPGDDGMVSAMITFEGVFDPMQIHQSLADLFETMQYNIYKFEDTPNYRARLASAAWTLNARCKTNSWSFDIELDRIMRSVDHYDDKLEYVHESIKEFFIGVADLGGYEQRITLLPDTGLDNPIVYLPAELQPSTKDIARFLLTPDMIDAPDAASYTNLLSSLNDAFDDNRDIVCAMFDLDANLTEQFMDGNNEDGSLFSSLLDTLVLSYLSDPENFKIVDLPDTLVISKECNHLLEIMVVIIMAGIIIWHPEADHTPEA